MPQHLTFGQVTGSPPQAVTSLAPMCVSRSQASASPYVTYAGGFLPGPRPVNVVPPALVNPFGNSVRMFPTMPATWPSNVDVGMYPTMPPAAGRGLLGGLGHLGLVGPGDVNELKSRLEKLGTEAWYSGAVINLISAYNAGPKRREDLDVVIDTTARIEAAVRGKIEAARRMIDIVRADGVTVMEDVVVGYKKVGAPRARGVPTAAQRAEAGKTVPVVESRPVVKKGDAYLKEIKAMELLRTAEDTHDLKGMGFVEKQFPEDVRRAVKGKAAGAMTKGTKDAAAGKVRASGESELQEKRDAARAAGKTYKETFQDWARVFDRYNEFELGPATAMAAHAAGAPVEKFVARPAPRRQYAPQYQYAPPRSVTPYAVIAPPVYRQVQSVQPTFVPTPVSPVVQQPSFYQPGTPIQAMAVKPINVYIPPIVPPRYDYAPGVQVLAQYEGARVY